MRYITVFPVLFLFLTASSGQTALKPDSGLITHSFRIVVIGSSTAAGVGANPPDSAWVNRYRAYLQGINPSTEVINLAKGGYQTCHLMPSGSILPAGRPQPDTLRNITKALSLHPDAIILNLPSNDAAAGYKAAEQLANFDTIIQTATRSGVPIWVCTPQPRHFSSNKIVTQLIVCKAISEKYGSRVINFWDPISAPNGLILMACNSGDGIHVNNSGHRKLFEQVRNKNIPAELVKLARK